MLFFWSPESPTGSPNRYLFGDAFLDTLFDGFWVPARPPGGEFAARAGHLWRSGNIAFGPPEGDITMCLFTFCSEASAKP